jgi:hypothetical protein
MPIQQSLPEPYKHIAVEWEDGMNTLCTQLTSSLGWPVKIIHYRLKLATFQLLYFDSIHGELWFIRCYEVFRSLHGLETHWNGSQGSP